LKVKELTDYEGAYWYEQRILTPLDWKESMEKAKKKAESNPNAELKLFCCPNRSISISGIEAQLDIWENTCNFVPDIVIIDYADILAPENSKAEFRHQQNETWQCLRKLSQSRHCLVVTATQVNAKSYSKDLLNMENFSEDKRKYAHVTGMFALNQTENEKKKGLMRLNWIVLREGEFNSSEYVYVLQNLNIGRPILGSFINYDIKDC
jgi:hypothetical protein